MSRLAIRVTLAGIGLTIGLLVALVLRPGDRGLALDAYVLTLGGLVLFGLVTWTSGALPRAGASPLDAERPGPDARPPQLPELARTEREIALGTTSAFDVHYRLRPVLREVAAHRLAARRGIELDGPPERARAALGEDAWALVRPDRERPRHHHAPGPSLAEVRRAIEALEEL